MGARYQYCKEHKVVEEYPSCSTFGYSKPAVLPMAERPVVWEHPQTKEVRYPGRNDGEMPKYYKDLGYERREIPSYTEHQKFNKEHGLVNHKAEGIRD